MTIDTKKLREMLVSSTPGPWDAVNLQRHLTHEEDASWCIKAPGNVTVVSRFHDGCPGDLRTIAALRNSAEELIAAAEERDQLDAELSAALARVAEYESIIDVIRKNESDAHHKAGELRDCGQTDVCALAPGCVRHWEERNRELLARAERAEKALRKIADGDAGHQGSFDWPEFYESIRNEARAALKGGE